MEKYLSQIRKKSLRPTCSPCRLRLNQGPQPTSKAHSLTVHLGLWEHVHLGLFSPPHWTSEPPVKKGQWNLEIRFNWIVSGYLFKCICALRAQLQNAFFQYVFCSSLAVKLQTTLTWLQSLRMRFRDCAMKLWHCKYCYNFSFPQMPTTEFWFEPLSYFHRPSRNILPYSLCSMDYQVFHIIK